MLESGKITRSGGTSKGSAQKDTPLREASKALIRQGKMWVIASLAMVAQRLDRPGSKLACHERWLDRMWLPEARDLGLHQLYRALDLLAEHGDAVERAVFWPRGPGATSWPRRSGG